MRPQGSPISSRSRRGAIPRTAPGPKLCPNIASLNPTQHQKKKYKIVHESQSRQHRQKHKSTQKVSTRGGRSRSRRRSSLIITKNDLKRHARTLSGDATGLPPQARKAQGAPPTHGASPIDAHLIVGGWGRARYPYPTIICLHAWPNALREYESEEVDFFLCPCHGGTEDEDEEEGPYLRLETRKRAQTNEAKSKHRRESGSLLCGSGEAAHRGVRARGVACARAAHASASHHASWCGATPSRLSAVSIGDAPRLRGTPPGLSSLAVASLWCRLTGYVRASKDHSL